MTGAVLLVLHIGCGAAGLVVGPLAMCAPKREGAHTTFGILYQALTLGLCVTAVGLVALNPSSWPLAPIAVGTEAAALGGWQVRRRARPGWLPVHINLMCGSYVSFVTAFLVVNFPGSPLPWVLPTVVATPLIAIAAGRARDRGPGTPRAQSVQSTRSSRVG